MKKISLLFFLGLVSLSGCSKNSNPVFSDKPSNNWGSLPQVQKDDQIVNAAYSDSGKNVGVECKVWVYNVVSKASNGEVFIPKTAVPDSNSYFWASDSTGHIIGRCTAIENVEKADIIQMYLYINSKAKPSEWKWTPHTAIVVSKDTEEMKWIDSNWVGPDSVGVHSVNYSDFSVWAKGGYTVYHVQ